MNEILDRVFWDNTLRDYLYTIIFILVVLLLNTLFSKLVADLIVRIFNKKQRVNHGQFRELVLSPIKSFVIVLTIMIAFGRLNFPGLLNVVIYKTDTKGIIEAIARAVLIFTFIWLCNRVVAFIAILLYQKARLTADNSDDQLVVFFRDLLKALIWILGVLLVLKFSFGFPLSNVLTGLSIVGAALALAFRESLENLIASFIIFFDKPFTVGDLVKVQNVNGTVEKIGLRSTRIRTTEKTFVTVPNKLMVDSILDNQSLRTQRIVVTRLELAKHSTHEQISKLVMLVEKLLLQEHVLDPLVYLAETGHLFHVIQVEYYVSADIPIKTYYKLRETVNLSIIKLLEENGVMLGS